MFCPSSYYFLNIWFPLLFAFMCFSLSVSSFKWSLGLKFDYRSDWMGQEIGLDSYFPVSLTKILHIYPSIFKSRHTSSCNQEKHGSRAPAGRWEHSTRGLHKVMLLQTCFFSAPPLHSPRQPLSLDPLWNFHQLLMCTKSLSKWVQESVAISPALPLAGLRFSSLPSWKAQVMQYELLSELVLHKTQFLGQVEGDPTQGNTLLPVFMCLIWSVISRSSKTIEPSHLGSWIRWPHKGHAVYHSQVYRLWNVARPPHPTTPPPPPRLPTVTESCTMKPHPEQTE